MKVNGGFFWAQKNGASIEIGTGGPNTISNCYFSGRPKWYQVTQWYRALRGWLSLPHTNYKDYKDPFTWSKVTSDEIPPGAIVVKSPEGVRWYGVRNESGT